MQTLSTEQLIKEHTDIIHQLERAGCLQGEVSYIRLPFRSFDQDVFFERRDTGKRRLTNGNGNTFPSDRIKVERTMLINTSRGDSGKKTIRVDTRSEKPNVVFFSDCGEKIDFQTQQLIGEIAFRLWHKSQQQGVSARDLSDVLRKLSAVAIHHTNENSQADMAKLLMFTDAEESRYLAPFAYIQGRPQKQALLDMKYVLDNTDLPDHVQPLRLETLVGLKRSLKPYASKALSDIKRALVNSQGDKSGLEVAAGLLEQHLRTNPHQAVDLYDMVMNKKEDNELVGDLANSTLIQNAGGDQSLTMSADDKRRVLKKEFIEQLINRC